jgi:hypothetical protein
MEYVRESPQTFGPSDEYGLLDVREQEPEPSLSLDNRTWVQDVLQL